jgi:signal transduction histidine kinase
MRSSRTHILLALLAFLPIALLTWLGTYLIRDAARSTDAAMQAVLTERLAMTDHQLIRDLRDFTDQLDALGGEGNVEAKRVALKLAEHPWVVECWLAAPGGEIEKVAEKPGIEPSADARAEHVPRAQAFAAVASDAVPPQASGRPAVWQTAVKMGGYNLQGRTPGVQDLPFPSGWHTSDGDFIYWRRNASGHLICARLDSPTLMEVLFSRIPPPGLEMYAGRLTLVTGQGIHLHKWGSGLNGSERPSFITQICSAPLGQWELGYTPAFTEFPKPYLFPIVLGVSSGSVLVLALAWIFFRENARELRLAQQRVSFVNQISHELKTPLTNIRLYADMAAQRAEAQGDKTAQRHLGVVEAETARLSRLIQNVLNYARQQRDRLSVQPRQLNLDEVVERTANHWRPLLEQKEFHIDLKLSGPPTMKADADALEQILGNLLSNVDKYAASGKWVAIRTETEGRSARLVVEDRGPGIPNGKRRSVFEPFERLRSDLNEGVSGTGIGLTISRELAELHGGKLEVCSVYRDGARFVLTLPIDTA